MNLWYKEDNVCLDKVLLKLSLFTCAPLCYINAVTKTLHQQKA